MQHCSKCNIDIRGNKSCCPLCQGNLIGEPEDPAFPVLPERRLSRGMFLRICVFIFIFEYNTFFTQSHLERIYSNIFIILIN